MGAPGARPLLTAKLLVPSVRPGAVDRPRLHRHLEAGSDCRLTVVVAPAGWGKTTLLSAWAADPARSRWVAWLSIDESDDEPVRFWTYLLSALERVAPELAADALSALRAPGLDPISLAVDALLNAATAAPGGYVLVLDDYHLLRDPAIQESVEFLLSYLPPALRLIIAARADPPLPLARMRARGVLAEIRVDALRCTTDEGVDLISGVVEVGGQTARVAAERTEGWPAGLQLAALTLRGAADPAAAAGRLSGGERHLLDYFSSEVLPGIDAGRRDLLVRASVLERLSGPLCDAVLQRDDSAALLESLARADLFITPLDEQWFRCHRLFRDVLRRELADSAPGARAELLGRAADWFLAQGQVEQAVEHRIAAGDAAGARELLRSRTRWFMDRGAMGALLRLGDGLPGAEADPLLCLDLALAAAVSGRAGRAIEWLTRAEPHIANGPEPAPGWRTLRAYADCTWAIYGTLDDVEAALTHARRAVELETDPALWGHVVALNTLGGVLLGAGRIAEAAEVLQQAWQFPVRPDLPPLMVLQTAGLLALAVAELGESDRASAVCAAVRDIASEAEQAWGEGAAAALAMLRLAEGRLALVRDPTAAVALLESAVHLARHWGHTTVLLGGLASLAAAQWATGDRAGARRTLDQAHEVSDIEQGRPVVVRQLAELDARIGRDASRLARSRRELVEDLTDRELAILRALRGPLSAREIGGELHLSINTVKGYTKSLYRKLGVVTRDEAVRHGHDLGLI
ncbi:LuxR C-terminal-related transcriptional regulator [Actinoplanes sp. NPDC051633]|uniref:helix-turn-helix transcriptional regulator n=1 Tax=Actinoplanes sp. NPDC051633 TaxID=3155670 RepID=UPI00341423F6